MKANDFLKLINSTLKVELPEEVLSKLDVDLPEGFESKFTENYLTRDRAKSDDDIISEITKKSNKSALTATDEQIKELLPFISEESRQKINSTFSTPEKLKLLKPALEEVIKNTKGKAANDDIRKVEEEWSNKVKGLQDTHKIEKQQLIQQMEEKNFEGYVTNKLSGYNFAKDFTPAREHINKLALLALKEKGYRYEFENGEMVVRQEKDGVVRDVYDGETKVTFNGLIDRFVTPFVAKSNPTPESKEYKKESPSFSGSEDLRSLMMAQQVQE